MEHKPTYLLMVTENNNNKFYEMIPQGDTILIKYGRVDVTCTEITKPISQWNSIYNSKIKKGYVDKSNLRVDLIQEVKPKKDFEYKPIPNKVVAEIVDRLQSFAKKAIAANYKVKANQVTQAMVDEAQNVLIKLTKSKSLEEFNNSLLELFMVIPRKMSHVPDFLANNSSDFATIINKEQDLLDVMKGQIVVANLNEPEDESEEYEHNCTILESMGLIIEEVTAKDVSIIKKELGESSSKYYASWKITNINTENRFKEFCKNNKLKKKDMKLLWHGTRSENVWNILKTGLVLRPTSSKINGKLYGMGCYFAPKAQKSLGYTSMGYWTSGVDSSGFMILHEVAYGIPFNVYSFDSKYYELNYEKLQKFQRGANCLHAHAGADTGSSWGKLQNDEIVVYKENQMTARYLVELR